MSEQFIGIDVSKGYADIVVLDSAQTIVQKSFRLDDTSNGHERLKSLLSKWHAQDKSITFYAAVESTGGLENNWLAALRTMTEVLPLYSARVNPKGVAQYIKAGLMRTVTDGVSAFAIAAYQLAHRHTLRYNEPMHPLEYLRPTWSTYTLVKKQRQQLYNNLHPILYTANPTILTYCRKGMPQWVCNVLLKYPTAPLLAKATKAKLSAIPYVSEERAEALINAAKKETGSRHDVATVRSIELIVNQIHNIDKTINSFESLLQTSVSDNADIKLLTSFKGMGVMSAIGLLINMPSIAMFDDSSKLAAFWGLHPVFKQSGDGQSISRMSKSGRIQPRAILYMVVLSSIVHNPLIRELYKKNLSKGMKKNAAIGVCMHKVARIVYGMLKTKKAFDASIDQKNSEKKHQIDKQEMIRRQRKELRRFQDKDPVAPISKRERKKRATEEKPQDELSSKTRSKSKVALCK
jgi:transposase